ncbi:MAG: hypothetical protein M3N56_02115 [Actinomycetota bacterium]|nr:hypothetical protein [Actinomycetota bacterium]
MAVGVGGATTPRSAAPSLWLRVRVWWHWPALARELAAGGDPAASAELTVVARQLIDLPAQQRLADTLERVMTAASRPPRPPSVKVPLNRREILGARDELAALAERLRDGTPAPVQGMAIAALLVHDSASPLYRRRAAQDVWSLAREARERLNDPLA